MLSVSKIFKLFTNDFTNLILLVDYYVLRRLKELFRGFKPWCTQMPEILKRRSTFIKGKSNNSIRQTHFDKYRISFNDI